jgi:glutaredoxin 3
MPALELYGSTQCPYTQELREWLEWNRRDYLEYDVDSDREAFARMQALTSGGSAVPVLVEDGQVVQVGWQGRSCFLGAQATSDGANHDQ